MVKSLKRDRFDTQWIDEFFLLGSRAVEKEKRLSEHVARDVAIGSGQYPGEAKKAQEGIGRWVSDVTVLPRYGFTAGAKPCGR
jgi:hypothetical protein